MKIKPVIAVPSGDTSGVGPEIAVRACASEDVRGVCEPVLIGSEKMFLFEASKAGIPRELLRIEDTGDPETECPYGIICAESGKQAYIALKKASDMCLSGEAAAMATTPLNKESLRAAGIITIGHTELLSEFTSTDDPVTMFKSGGMKIFFLTRHLSLMQACERVTFDNVLSGIVSADRAMKLISVTDSRPLAVAGLNPHNGEHGMFGTEEGEHIVPAIEDALSMGINVTGPVPADSVFHLALQGRYSAVLSLYHDQGHIAAKTYDFAGTISMTIGLPYLRTSVDHGTAFDIAGKGIADITGMKNALIAAAEYGSNYRINFMQYNTDLNGLEEE